MKLIIALLLGTLFSLTNLLADEDSLIAAHKSKLETIVIPAVDFEKAPFTEAIDMMRMLAADADPTTDPRRRGMNFVLLSTSRQVNDITITVHMKNIPLGDALDEIAKQAGHKVTVQQYAVVFVPENTETERPQISR